MRSVNLILKDSWKLDNAFSQKLMFWVKIEHECFSSFFANLPSFTILKDSYEEDHNIDLHKKFELFISFSLSIALILMSLATPTNTPRFKHIGVNVLFLLYSVQLNGSIQKCSNERCGQTAADKMLKILE